MREISSQLANDMKKLLEAGAVLSSTGEHSPEEYTRARMAALALRGTIERYAMQVNIQQALEGGGDVAAVLLAGLWGLVDYMDECCKEHPLTAIEERIKE
jgi:hypothetical protein